MPKIIIRKSGKIESEHELQSESVAVGREAGNDIVLKDPSVSRRHAKIESTESGYRVVDLDSGNGVLHHGKSTPSLDLYPGCEIEIGAYSLTYESEEAQVPKLVLIGGATQKIFSVSQDETVLGRSSEVSITVDDRLVSSSHLKILRHGNIWALVDLESQNGTRVNGVRVTEIELKHEDQIQVGGITFFFSETGEVPKPGSIQIIEAAQTPQTEPAPPSFDPIPAPEPPPVAAAVSKTTAPKKSGMPLPRLILIVLSVFTVFLLIFAVVTLRSPEDATEKEFQQVFQSDLTVEEAARIGEYFVKAKEYDETENFRLALEQYQKILVLDGKHQEALAESARLEERLLQAENERIQQDREQRELAARVAGLTEQADQLVSDGKFQEAQSVLKEAMALAPDSEFLSQKMAASYVAMGNALRRRNTNEALKAYQQALEIAPGDGAAKEGIDRINRNRRAAGQRKQQIDELTEAGLAQLKQEEYKEAYASFSKVLEIDSNNARAREFRDQAQQLVEQQVEPMYEEGVRLFNNDELVAAMHQFNQVLAIYPDHADTLAFMNRALERTRGEAVDKYKRAYIYEGLGKLREAKALYEEALALLPDPKEEYHQKAKQRIADIERKLR